MIANLVSIVLTTPDVHTGFSTTCTHPFIELKFVLWTFQVAALVKPNSSFKGRPCVVFVHINQYYKYKLCLATNHALRNDLLFSSLKRFYRTQTLKMDRCARY